MMLKMKYLVRISTKKMRTKNSGTILILFCEESLAAYTSGWWYSYPSEKSWTSSVGMMTFHSQIKWKVTFKIPWFQSPPTSISLYQQFTKHQFSIVFWDPFPKQSHFPSESDLTTNQTLFFFENRASKPDENLSFAPSWR